MERSTPGEGLAGALCCAHSGCDLLTACASGCLQQGLPLSPEDLLPFNPLFQDEILSARASVQPGHHSEGMQGEGPDCWWSLSPVLAVAVPTVVISVPSTGHRCPLAVSNALSHPSRAALPCPVFSSGESIPAHSQCPLPATGQSKKFSPLQIQRLWIRRVLPWCWKSPELMCPSRLQLGLLADIPGPSRLPGCISRAPEALPPVSWLC